MIGKFYVGNEYIKECELSRDKKVAGIFTGIPVNGGVVPKIYKGTVVAIDPNRSSAAPGREWRITIRIASGEGVTRPA